MELLPDPFAFLHHLQPLELPALALGLVVQARVLDGDRGLGREDHEDAFVLLVEHLGTLLVGEVDVPEHRPSTRDPSAEERRHRRVVRREAHRARVCADVGDAQRARPRGSGRPSRPCPMGGSPRAARSSGVIPTVMKSWIERPSGVEDPERPVACAREVNGEFDDPLEHDVQRAARRRGPSLPGSGGDPRRRGPSRTWTERSRSRPRDRAGPCPGLRRGGPNRHRVLRHQTDRRSEGDHAPNGPQGAGPQERRSG